MDFTPLWWNRRGSKIVIKEFNKRERKLVLFARAVTLTICRAPFAVFDGWHVNWQIIHLAQGGAVEGRLSLSSEEVRNAFGLVGSGRHVGDLLTRYQADVAEIGKYIRRGVYLNIPGPGTGHQGDPNISIEVTPEIKQAIQTLLQS